MHTNTNNPPQPFRHFSEGEADNQQRGKAVFNVSTIWQGGLKSKAICDATYIEEHKFPATGHLISSDEPEILGGKSSAPSPQELLLAAFNSCMLASYITAARSENIHIEKFSIATSGELDIGHFLGLDTSDNLASETLRYVITISGSGTLAQFEKLHQVVIATSPNRWIIGKGMLIEGDLIIE